MNEKNIEVEEGFYLAVARLLGCVDHVYKPWPYAVRNRWNHRYPGNGRYPGHGMVRRYSPNMIHVSLHTPRLVGTFGSDALALAAISELVDTVIV